MLPARTMSCTHSPQQPCVKMSYLAHTGAPADSDGRAGIYAYADYNVLAKVPEEARDGQSLRGTFNEGDQLRLSARQCDCGLRRAPRLQNVGAAHDHAATCRLTRADATRPIAVRIYT